MRKTPVSSLDSSIDTECTTLLKMDPFLYELVATHPIDSDQDVLDIEAKHRNRDSKEYKEFKAKIVRIRAHLRIEKTIAQIVDIYRKELVKLKLSSEIMARQCKDYERFVRLVKDDHQCLAEEDYKEDKSLRKVVERIRECHLKSKNKNNLPTFSKECRQCQTLVSLALKKDGEIGILKVEDSAGSHVLLRQQVVKILGVYQKGIKEPEAIFQELHKDNVSKKLIYIVVRDKERVAERENDVVMAFESRLTAEILSLPTTVISRDFFEIAARLESEESREDIVHSLNVSSSLVDLIANHCRNNASSFKQFSDLKSQLDAKAGDSSQEEIIIEDDRSMPASGFLISEEDMQYDLVLMSVSEGEALRKIKEQAHQKSKESNNSPVLIQQGKKLFIYGKPTDVGWKLTELDEKLVDKWPSSTATQIHPDIYKNIASKNGHVQPIQAAQARAMLRVRKIGRRVVHDTPKSNNIEEIRKQLQDTPLKALADEYLKLIAEERLKASGEDTGVKEIELLAQIRGRLQKGKSAQEIAKELSVSPEFVEQAIPFSQIDQAVRSGNDDPHFRGKAFETMRFAIAGIRDARHKQYTSFPDQKTDESKEKVTVLDKRSLISSSQSPLSVSQRGSGKPREQSIEMRIPPNLFSQLRRHDLERAIEISGDVQRINTRYADSPELSGLFISLMYNPTREKLHQHFIDIFSPDEQNLKRYIKVLVNEFKRAGGPHQETILQMLFTGPPLPGQELAFKRLCGVGASGSFVRFLEYQLNRNTDEGTETALEFIKVYPEFFLQHYSEMYLTERGFYQLVLLLDALNDDKLALDEEFKDTDSAGGIPLNKQNEMRLFSAILAKKPDILYAIFEHSVNAIASILNRPNIDKAGRERTLSLLLREGLELGFVEKWCNSTKPASAREKECHLLLLQHLFQNPERFKEGESLWRSFEAMGRVFSGDAKASMEVTIIRQQEVIDAVIKRIGEKRTLDETQKEKVEEKEKEKKQLVEERIKDAISKDPFTTKDDPLANSGSDSEDDLIQDGEYGDPSSSSSASSSSSSSSRMSITVSQRKTKKAQVDEKESVVIPPWRGRGLKKLQEPQGLVYYKANSPDLSKLPAFTDLAMCLLNHVIAMGVTATRNRERLSEIDGYLEQVKSWGDDYCFLLFLAIGRAPLMLGSANLHKDILLLEFSTLLQKPLIQFMAEGWDACHRSYEKPSPDQETFTEKESQYEDFWEAAYNPVPLVDVVSLEFGEWDGRQKKRTQSIQFQSLITQLLAADRDLMAIGNERITHPSLDQQSDEKFFRSETTVTSDSTFVRDLTTITGLDFKHSTHTVSRDAALKKINHLLNAIKNLSAGALQNFWAYLGQYSPSVIDRYMYAFLPATLFADNIYNTALFDQTEFYHIKVAIKGSCARLPLPLSQHSLDHVQEIFLDEMKKAKRYKKAEMPLSQQEAAVCHQELVEFTEGLSTAKKEIIKEDKGICPFICAWESTSEYLYLYAVQTQFHNSKHRKEAICRDLVRISQSSPGGVWYLLETLYKADLLQVFITIEISDQESIALDIQKKIISQCGQYAAKINSENETAGLYRKFILFRVAMEVFLNPELNSQEHLETVSAWLTYAKDTTANLEINFILLKLAESFEPVKLPELVLSMDRQKKYPQPFMKTLAIDLFLHPEEKAEYSHFLMLSTQTSVLEVYNRFGLSTHMRSLPKFVQRVFTYFNHINRLLHEADQIEDFDGTSLQILQQLRDDAIHFFVGIAQALEIFREESGHVGEDRILRKFKENGYVGQTLFFLNRELGVSLESQLRGLLSDKHNDRFALRFSAKIIEDGWRPTISGPMKIGAYVGLLRACLELDFHHLPSTFYELVTAFSGYYYRKLCEGAASTESVVLPGEALLNRLRAARELSGDRYLGDFLIGVLKEIGADTLLDSQAYRDGLTVEYGEYGKAVRASRLIDPIFNGFYAAAESDRESKHLEQLKAEIIEAALQEAQTFLLSFIEDETNDFCLLMETWAFQFAKQYADIVKNTVADKTYKYVYLHILLNLAQKAIEPLRAIFDVIEEDGVILRETFFKGYNSYTKLIFRDRLLSQTTILTKAPPRDRALEEKTFLRLPRLTTVVEFFSNMSRLSTFDFRELLIDFPHKIYTEINNEMKVRVDILEYSQAPEFVDEAKFLQMCQKVVYSERLAHVDFIIDGIKQALRVAGKLPFTDREPDSKTIQGEISLLLKRCGASTSAQDGEPTIVNVVLTEDIHTTSTLGVILLRLAKDYGAPDAVGRRIAKTVVQELITPIKYLLGKKEEKQNNSEDMEWLDTPAPTPTGDFVDEKQSFVEPPSRILRVVLPSLALVPSVTEYEKWYQCFRTLLWLAKTINVTLNWRVKFDSENEVATVSQVLKAALGEGGDYASIHQFLTAYDLLVLPVDIMPHDSSRVSSSPEFDEKSGPSTPEEAQSLIPEMVAGIRSGLPTAASWGDLFLPLFAAFDSEQENNPLSWCREKQSQQLHDTLLNQHLFALVTSQENQYVAYCLARYLRDNRDGLELDEKDRKLSHLLHIYFKTPGGKKLARALDKHIEKMEQESLTELLVDGIKASFDNAVAKPDLLTLPLKGLFKMHFQKFFTKTGAAEARRHEDVIKERVKELPSFSDKSGQIEHFLQFLKIMIPGVVDTDVLRLTLLSVDNFSVLSKKLRKLYCDIIDLTVDRPHKESVDAFPLVLKFHVLNKLLESLKESDSVSEDKGRHKVSIKKCLDVLTQAWRIYRENNWGLHDGFLECIKNHCGHKNNSKDSPIYKAYQYLQLERADVLRIYDCSHGQLKEELRKIGDEILKTTFESSEDFNDQLEIVKMIAALMVGSDDSQISNRMEIFRQKMFSAIDEKIVSMKTPSFYKFLMETHLIDKLELIKKFIPGITDSNLDNHPNFSIWTKIIWKFYHRPSEQSGDGLVLFARDWLNGPDFEQLLDFDIDKAKILLDYLSTLDPDKSDQSWQSALTKARKLYHKQRPLSSEEQAKLLQDDLLSYLAQDAKHEDTDKALFDEMAEAFSKKLKLEESKGTQSPARAAESKEEKLSRPQILSKFIQRFLDPRVDGYEKFEAALQKIVDTEDETEQAKITGKLLSLICSSLCHLESSLCWSIASDLLGKLSGDTEKSKPSRKRLIALLKKVLTANKDQALQIGAAFLKVLQHELITVDPISKKLLTLQEGIEALLPPPNQDDIKPWETKVRAFAKEAVRNLEASSILNGFPSLKQQIIEELKAIKHLRGDADALEDQLTQIKKKLTEAMDQVKLQRKRFLATAITDILWDMDIRGADLSDPSKWKEIDPADELRELQSLFKRWQEVCEDFPGVEYHHSRGYFSLTEVPEQIPASKIARDFRILLSKQTLSGNSVFSTEYIGHQDGEAKLISKFFELYITDGGNVTCGPAAKQFLNFIKEQIWGEIAHNGLDFFRSAIGRMFSILWPDSDTLHASILRKFSDRFMNILFLHWNKLLRNYAVEYSASGEEFKEYADCLLKRMRIFHGFYKTAVGKEHVSEPVLQSSGLIELQHFLQLMGKEEDSELIARVRLFAQPSPVKHQPLSAAPKPQEASAPKSEEKSEEKLEEKQDDEYKLAALCVRSNVLGSLLGKSLSKPFAPALQKLFESESSSTTQTKLTGYEILHNLRAGISDRATLVDLIFAVIAITIGKDEPVGTQQALKRMCQAGIEQASAFALQEITANVVDALDKLKSPHQVPRQTILQRLLFTELKAVPKDRIVTRKELYVATSVTSGIFATPSTKEKTLQAQQLVTEVKEIEKITPGHIKVMNFPEFGPWAAWYQKVRWIAGLENPDEPMPPSSWHGGLQAWLEGQYKDKDKDGPLKIERELFEAVQTRYLDLLPKQRELLKKKFKNLIPEDLSEEDNSVLGMIIQWNRNASRFNIRFDDIDKVSLYVDLDSFDSSVLAGILEQPVIEGGQKPIQLYAKYYPIAGKSGSLTEEKEGEKYVGIVEGITMTSQDSDSKEHKKSGHSLRVYDSAAKIKHAFLLNPKVTIYLLQCLATWLQAQFKEKDRLDALENRDSLTPQDLLEAGYENLKQWIPDDDSILSMHLARFREQIDRYDPLLNAKPLTDFYLIFSKKFNEKPGLCLGLYKSLLASRIKEWSEMCFSELDAQKIAHLLKFGNLTIVKRGIIELLWIRQLRQFGVTDTEINLLKEQLGRLSGITPMSLVEDYLVAKKGNGKPFDIAALIQHDAKEKKLMAKDFFEQKEFSGIYNALHLIARVLRTLGMDPEKQLVFENDVSSTTQDNLLSQLATYLRGIKCNPPSERIDCLIHICTCTNPFLWAEIKSHNVRANSFSINDIIEPSETYKAIAKFLEGDRTESKGTTRIVSRKEWHDSQLASAHAVNVIKNLFKQADLEPLNELKGTDCQWQLSLKNFTLLLGLEKFAEECADILIKTASTSGLGRWDDVVKLLHKMGQMLEIDFFDASSEESEKQQAIKLIKKNVKFINECLIPALASKSLKMIELFLEPPSESLTQEGQVVIASMFESPVFDQQDFYTPKVFKDEYLKSMKRISSILQVQDRPDGLSLRGYLEQCGGVLIDMVPTISEEGLKPNTQMLEYSTTGGWALKSIGEKQGWLSPPIKTIFPKPDSYLVTRHGGRWTLLYSNTKAEISEVKLGSAPRIAAAFAHLPKLKKPKESIISVERAKGSRSLQRLLDPIRKAIMDYQEADEVNLLQFDSLLIPGPVTDELDERGGNSENTSLLSSTGVSGTPLVVSPVLSDSMQSGLTLFTPPQSSSESKPALKLKQLCPEALDYKYYLIPEDAKLADMEPTHRLDLLLREKNGKLEYVSKKHEKPYRCEVDLDVLDLDGPLDLDNADQLEKIARYVANPITETTEEGEDIEVKPSQMLRPSEIGEELDNDTVAFENCTSSTSSTSSTPSTFYH